MSDIHRALVISIVAYKTSYNVLGLSGKFSCCMIRSTATMIIQLIRE